jgi:hypothetical protein
MNAQRCGHGGPAAGGRESGVEKVESRFRECPAGRHGGPPPRHPVSGPTWMVCSGGCPAGRGAGLIPVCSLPIGTGVFRWMPSGRTRRSALPRRCCWVHSHGCLGTKTQRSGHRGPPPRHPVSGPRRMVCSGGCPAGRGAGLIPVCSLPIGTGVFGRTPSGRTRRSGGRRPREWSRESRE